MEYKITMNINLIFKKNICLMILCLVGFMTADSFSQDMAVPVNLQAALFKKIFSFDKTLSGKGIEVAVIGGGGEAMVSAFKDAGINAKVVSGDIPASSSVVYLMPGAPKSQSSQKKILSISGVTSYVEDGRVAIGLGVEGGKPRIIINVKQLKSEGQDLNSDILNIAKIIQ